MENQEGFERLVPYRTEKELKEATKWYNTVDCKKIIDRETIEMILYNALNKYAPWEDFCMDERDVKGFFYINALAYALLTFKYLSSPYMTLENIMCDSKQGEAVEGNIGLKSKIKEFQEKCRGICNNNERWKEKIREKVETENRSEDQKIKIEHYVNLIKLPCTYIFFSQDKIKDFLAPVVREIVWNITEKKRTESIDYKMMRVLQLYTEYIDGRPPVEEWDEWMDDENEMATQRKRKERLMKQYDEFCKELVEIGNKRDENESCSEYMINEFAKEMIYHSRAIIEFENFLTTLKDVSVDMNVDIKDAIKSEVNRWVLNLDYKCDIPVVFCTEGLTFFKKNFSRNRYVSFLCEVVRSIYVLAGRNSQKAYDILKKYVDEGGSGNRPALKTLKLWEKPSKQNKCRAFAIRTVLEAITPQDPYREDIDMISVLARVI